MSYGKYTIEQIKNMFGDVRENRSEFLKYKKHENVEIISNCGYGVVCIQSLDNPELHSYLNNYGNSVLLL